MPIDARIPIMAGQSGFSLRDILRDAEQRDFRDRQLALQEQQAAREQAQYDQKQRARGSLADLIIADRRTAPNQRPGTPTPGLSQLATQGAPMSFDQAFSPETMATIQGGGTPQPAETKGMSGLDPSVPSPTSNVSAPNVQAPDMQAKWESYVRDDPDGAQAYEKNRTAITRDQVKMYSELNNAGMQLLGGVTDQASYDAARRQAEALYARYGFDPGELQLPAEYSPATINRLRYQAMSTEKQLQQIRADRKLDWDIEDREADNDRLDRNTDSLIRDRDARRGEARRYHDQRDTTTRRGQDFRSRDTQRGQDISATRPRGGGKGGASVTATGPGGVQIHYDAGKKAWVDAKGNPVQ